MKVLFRVGLAAAVLALGFWIWTVLFPRPEKIIREHLKAMAQCASFAPNEGALSRLTNLEKLGGFFATDARIVFDGPEGRRHTVNGRDDITYAARAMRGHSSAMQVKFLDVKVIVGLEKQTAQAELTVRVSVPEDKDWIVQEMRFFFRKINSHWLVIRAETVNPLS